MHVQDLLYILIMKIAVSDYKPSKPACGSYEIALRHTRERPRQNDGDDELQDSVY